MPVSTTSWHANLPSIQYDFASNGVDHESFRFDLWQRYIKSALRQSDRLLSYGEPQGEAVFVRYLLTTSVSEETSTVLLTIL